MSRILVAMSGGVDSSSVASKLLEDGHYVEGVTLDFGCFCSEISKIDAKKIAEQLKIEHHFLKCERQLEDNVIKYFANEYFNGRTPNPCVVCNRKVKFYELIKFMKDNNFDYIATGHYAKITNHNDEYWLEKGVDEIKDQSYFLGQLKYEYLQYIIFPLCDITKNDIRKYAKQVDLLVAEKEESQDICFTKGKSYKDILQIYNQQNFSKGDIILLSTGQKIGEHNGIINYTQGQRKGLGIGWKESLFVIDIDANKNIVYVDTEQKLFKEKFNISNVNYLDLSLKNNIEYMFDVKLRSTNYLNKATIVFNNDNATVILHKKSRNISKGQLCVIYDGNRVVASGFIEN